MIPPFLWRAFRANETAVHELNYLFWECTTRCNLHCRHCGSDCFASSADSDMPLEDFLKAFDTIPRESIAKPFTVVLTGGEPVLRPDIEEIGRALRSRGVSWSIVSNGWFYDEQKHKALMAAGLGALTISLDGLEESHDWMRGRSGSFLRARRAIELAAAEKRLNFDVVSCINRRNLSELEQMYSLLTSLGVKQWRLFSIIPIGRAASDKEMLLSAEEFRSLLEFIKNKRADKSAPMKVTFSCEGHLGKYDSAVRDTPFFCRAGINIASVLIDGTICACPNIDRKIFGQGNIYKDNFFRVWEEGFELFRSREKWARKGSCAECKLFRDCLGGGMHNWHGDISDGPLVCLRDLAL
ncbi:MAG: TIGR04133 family radical SAM/SPASM protein [Bacteroidales bacterium]|nr:TIGR04133 family radical SAM/SPASM protein [Bacteroidales bacterium]